MTEKELLVDCLAVSYALETRGFNAEDEADADLRILLP
jgi:hypothetical protein